MRICVPSVIRRKTRREVRKREVGRGYVPDGSIRPRVGDIELDLRWAPRVGGVAPTYGQPFASPAAVGLALPAGFGSAWINLSPFVVSLSNHAVRGEP